MRNTTLHISFDGRKYTVHDDARSVFKQTYDVAEVLGVIVHHYDQDPDTALADLEEKIERQHLDTVPQGTNCDSVKIKWKPLLYPK